MTTELPESDASDPSGTPPSFEDALNTLQQIVNDLESGSLGLDASLQQFEHGTGLLRHCYGLLEAAEHRIEILTGRNAAGEPVTEPFDATATHQPKESRAGRRPRTRTAKSPPPPEDEPHGLF